MKVLLVTFALVSILLKLINAKPQATNGDLLRFPEPKIPNINFQDQPNPFQGYVNQQKMDLSEVEKLLRETKQAATNAKQKSSGLLQNFVPRIDNMINKVRGLADDLTLGLSEFAFNGILRLPSEKD